MKQRYQIFYVALVTLFIIAIHIKKVNIYISLNDGRVPDLERPLVALVDPVVSLLLQRVRHRFPVKIIIMGCKVQR